MRKWVVVLVAVALAVLTPSGAAGAAPVPPAPKIVYLTFDDGPDARNTPRLLKVLARERVPATFFVVGQALASDPGHGTRLWLSGHAVGNHTWSHPDLTLLPPSAINQQIVSTARLIGPGAGACLRPPYGATGPTVLAAARLLGLKQVLWTVDPEDWAHQDADYIVNHVAPRVRNRSNILLHDGGGDRSATIAAVRRLIPMLRQRGFEFRTVPACRVPLGAQVYGFAKPERPKPAPGKKKPVAPSNPPPTQQPTTPPPTAVPAPGPSVMGP